MDMGLLATAIAAIIAFGWGRGQWLRHLLLLSWVAVTLGSLAGAKMATIVFTMATMDMVVAGAALIIATHDPTRFDARIVGAISMALMPAHWVMALTHGAGDWTLYAATCNAGFVLQCLIIRGWLDGVGGSIGRFFARLRPVHLFRSGK